jgi:exodeoxyribonuclease V beta subunit
MTIRYPRPPILDMLLRDRHAVIEASAGTGKTFTIEHLVVDLVLRHGARIDDLLMLTFTERAANELRTRIRAKLVEIVDNSPGRADSNGQGEANGDGEAFWLIDDPARLRLTQAIISLDGAAIGTIHSFFKRVLSEQAFAGRRLFDGTLEDGRALFAHAFKRALRCQLARVPGPAAAVLELWLDRVADITALEDRLYRLHVARRDIRPAFDPEAVRREITGSSLMGLKDQTELDRLAAALKAAKLHGTKVKNTCSEHLPTVIRAIERSGGDPVPLMDPEVRKSIRYLATNLAGLNLTGNAAATAQTLARLDRLVVPLEAAVVHTCLPIVQRVLDQHKLRSGAYDFDGIIAGVAEAVMAPGGEVLVRSLRQRYRYVLIDEFQDTDDLQWRVFKKVFIEETTDHHAYLIGDPKQAIYGFRGADVNAYIAARTEIQADGSEPIPLKENHRSTAELIAACNLIFDQNDESPFFSSGAIRYGDPVGAGKSLSAMSTDGTPSPPVYVLEIEPRGETLAISELRRALARRIAREVHDVLLGPGRLLFGEPGAEKPVAKKDVFVLTATNRDAERVVAALRAAGIPSALYKQEGLFQTAEARAVRDLLAALDDPRRQRRSRAWITPFFSVPLQSLPELADLPPHHPLCKRLDDWRELAAKGRFETLFARILDESGIVLRELLFKSDERALTNYFHLFEILLEQARSTGAGLTELVATLDGYIRGTRLPATEDGNVQRLETDHDAVQVMTIHKSKGLEAAVILLYGGFTRSHSGPTLYHDGLTAVQDLDPAPEAKEIAQRERNEEDQRLYYVALTRAKARLYLPFVPEQFWKDGAGAWKGGYQCVNRRLARVLTNPEAGRLFVIRTFRDEPPAPVHVPEGPGTGECGALRPPESWKPPLRDLEPRDRAGEFASLRERHRPFIVTSYSHMKHAGTSAAPIEPEDFDRESAEESEPDPDALPEDALPGGRGAGTLLHEVLERVSFPETAAAGNLDAWRRIDSVTQVVDFALTRSGIGAAHRPEVEAIVYRALMAAIPLGPSGAIPGFCRCPRAVREMEFLFPIPETSHPRLSDRKPAKLLVDRGFLKGFIDLVVEYRGRVYAVDWKSDVLEAYDPDSVAKCVQDHYSVQANLYSLALVKALQVRTEAAYEARCGGMFYVFLRGLREPASDRAGVYFMRPTWRAILEYEQELVRFGEPSAGGSR